MLFLSRYAYLWLLFIPGASSFNLILVCLAVSTSLARQTSINSEPARCERQARNVKIIRDDWGIAHVYGKTDADAVFGMVYAQAEDDFNRIEINYLNSMGRLGEAEGVPRIFQRRRFRQCQDAGFRCRIQGRLRYAAESIDRGRVHHSTSRRLLSQHLADLFFHAKPNAFEIESD